MIDRIGGRSRVAWPSFVAFVGLTASVGGCLATPPAQRGYPLYEVAAERPPANQVASLGTILPGGSTPGGGATSFIKSIDGRDVSTLAETFELEPGCHVVETASGLVVTNDTITFRGQLGTRVFPFRMRAGHQYLVVVEFGPSAGSTVRVSLFAEERDASGAHTQQVAPATSPADVQACRAWTPPAS
jgi:hypothetical protein